MFLDHYANFEISNLPNGLKVYNYKWPYNVGYHRIGLIIHTGSDKDPVGLEGLAHYVEHMVANSCKTNEMEDFFSDKGGFITFGNTSFKGISYRFKTSNDRDSIKESLEKLSEIIFNANLTEQGLEKQRNIIRCEFLKSYPNNFSYERILREHSSVYPNTFLERLPSLLENLETITNISLKDIKTFYDIHYVPANMSIVSVGNLSIEEITNMLSSTEFGRNYNIGKLNPKPDLNPSIINPKEHFYEYELHKVLKMEKQYDDFFSYSGVTSLPNTVSSKAIYIYMNMLITKLNDVFREDLEATYHIDCCMYNFRHFYNFQIYSSNLNLRILPDINTLIQDCVKGCLSKDNFEKERRHSLMYLQSLDEKGSDILDNSMGDLEDYHQIITIQDSLDKYSNLEFQDVEHIASLLSSDRLWTCITKP